MTAETRKVTITLRQHLLKIADRLAARVNTSRSQVISQALAAAEVREQERMAAAGYRLYAGEAVEFADASSHLLAEASATTPTEVTNGET
jgi:metal-responsive CopG/Arc/MetJ family transcriptional regulator